MSLARISAARDSQAGLRPRLWRVALTGLDDPFIELCPLAHSPVYDFALQAICRSKPFVLPVTPNQLTFDDRRCVVTRHPAIRRTIAVELSSAMWASAVSRLPPFLLHPLPFVCSAAFLAAKIAVVYRPPVVCDEQLATPCPDTNPPSRHGSRGHRRGSVFKGRWCHRQWGIMHPCLPYSARPTPESD